MEDKAIVYYEQAASVDSKVGVKQRLAKMKAKT